MAAFKSKLLLDDENGFPMTLAGPFVYESDLLGLIVVPEGFGTDLASIPQALWSVLPKVGKWDRAAVVHDYLYQHGYARVGSPVTRAQADAVLREAMIAGQVAGRRRFEIYWGVRLGGWVAWNKYRASHAPDAPEIKLGS